MAEMEGIEEKYLIGEKIGCGASGCVYRATDKQTGEVVAIKEIPLEKYKREEVVREMENIKYLTPRCPGVVRYIFYIDEPSTNKTYIITEYIDAKPFDEIKDRTNLLLFTQFVKAVNCIHLNGVIHRDIKPDNVIFMDNDVKLIDFGQSCRCDQSHCFKTMAGTPIYMAPEAIADNSHSCEVTRASDIWSMAVTFYELLHDTVPFNEDAYYGIYEDFQKPIRSYQRTLERIQKNKGRIQAIMNPPRTDDGFDGKIDNILARMLNINWKQRPSCQEILMLLGEE